MAVREIGDIVRRYEKNPIITREDIPFPCNSVFNAAAAKFKDEYILLLRVEGLEGKSSFWLAKSEDGLSFNVLEKPVMVLSQEGPFAPYERRGIEDPRITQIEGTYYILYTAYSRYGPLIALATTEDFENFERVAIVSEPNNKDAVLFPKRFNGRFARFDRPTASPGEGSSMWISYSYDLVYWGDPRVVIETRPGYWDSYKVGAGSPPIEADVGWLEIYHGVKRTSAGSIYRLGCALFDLQDPSRLIGRSEAPILVPREHYERTGDVPNVIFTCGSIYEQATGEVKIYYGAADTRICLGVVYLDELLMTVI